MSAPRVLIAASGTGGHLFPALAIAHAVKRISPGAEILFLGSGRPLEKSLVDGAGFQRVEVPIVGLKNRGLRGMADFFRLLPRAVWGVGKVVTEFSPTVIIGVGGYVTFLPVLIGRVKRIPTWIHEAEKRAGMANNILAYFASRVSLAFSDAKVPCPKKHVVTGQPVRDEFRSISQPSAVTQARRILIMGGSQGAQSLDDAGAALAPWFTERGLEIWHQCRPSNVERVGHAYTDAGTLGKAVPFIENPIAAFSWADVIVSRSGAGTVMELGIVGKPSILVPYPHAQGNHQYFNAKVLADAGKALIAEEGPGFTDRLKQALTNLMDPAVYRVMIERPGVARNLDAADKIAQGCLNLASGA